MLNSPDIWNVLELLILLTSFSTSWYHRSSLPWWLHSLNAGLPPNPLVRIQSRTAHMLESVLPSTPSQVLFSKNYFYVLYLEPPFCVWVVDWTDLKTRVTKNTRYGLVMLTRTWPGEAKACLACHLNHLWLSQHRDRHLPSLVEFMWLLLRFSKSWFFFRVPISGQQYFNIKLATLSPLWKHLPSEYLHSDVSKIQKCWIIIIDYVKFKSVVWGYLNINQIG